MNAIKKILGVAWIALGLYAGYYLFSNYWEKIGSPKLDESIQAIIFIFVLVPIVTGALLRFGVYALQGEYNEES